MQRIWIIASIVFLAFVTGCSSNNNANNRDNGEGYDFKPGVFAREDTCIVKNDTKEKVCYGDSQSEAEKVVGKGQQEGKRKYSMMYEDGIRIIYREDHVVCIGLFYESEGVYSTARGVKIGDKITNVHEAYGEEFLVYGSNNEQAFYAFDTANWKQIMDYDQVGKAPDVIGISIHDFDGKSGIIQIADAHYYHYAY
jgi:hypothetical protein